MQPQPISEHRAIVVAANARAIEASNRFLTGFANFWIAAGLVSILSDTIVQLANNYTGPAVLLSGLLTRAAIYLGYMRAARYAIVVSLSLAALYLPLLINGVRTPIIAVWPLIILLAGWLLGKRAAAIVAVLSIGAITLLWQLEAQGLLILPVGLRQADAWWRTVSAIVALTAVTVWYWAGSFDAMNAHERELVKLLDQANATLTQQLSHTDTTLTQVRTDYEKAYPMAMMAAVIPSLAHDLNTPVGNVGLAASTLSDHLAEFRKTIESGSLRRSTIDTFLNTLSEGLTIIEAANRRTGELVGSLKQMSVDQVTQKRRTFALDRLVSEVLTTLTPTLKQRHITVVEDIASGMNMDSYPGPLGQVITNLVQNALVHAFEQRLTGTVTLRAKALDTARLRIEVEDNGVGMSDEVRAKVFHSFFTTKLGKGGSGIGLTFSKRLIEETLGGTIAVESAVNAGSRFILDLPLTAPTEPATATRLPEVADDSIEVSAAGVDAGGTVSSA